MWVYNTEQMIHGNSCFARAAAFLNDFRRIAWNYNTTRSRARSLRLSCNTQQNIEVSP